MESLNCPNCKRAQKFSAIEKRSYQCESCHSTYKMCKAKHCTKLVKIGPFCTKCIDKGFKKGGSLGLTAATIAASIGLAVLRRGR